MYFLNNFVKTDMQISTIFGKKKFDVNRPIYKFCPHHLNTVATLSCEMLKS